MFKDLRHNLFYVKANGVRASPPDFIKDTNSDQSAEFVEELEDIKNRL